MEKNGMFTGLVQGLGRVRQASENALEVEWLSAGAEAIAGDLALGDSVAVDGVCLTVTAVRSRGFLADVSPETTSRTTLGRSPLPANLEASLRVGSKLGGHFVTGHIDGVGCLMDSYPTATAWEMSFAAPEDASDLWHQHIAPFLAPKGSITVNGISLTIADVDGESTWFKVAVIPLTYQETNLSLLQPGDRVNLETDILGKYVARLLRFPNDRALEGTAIGSITPAFLAEHGYL